MLENASNLRLPSRIRDRTSAPRSTATVFAVSAIFAASLSFASFAAAAPSNKESGIWYDDTGKGAVEIFGCGDKLCGRIIWLRDPLAEDGQPLTDGYNPTPSMRSRPICGLQILGNLTRQSDGTLDGGWVYDPKVGKSYDAALAIEDRNTLVLTGYKGVKLLSKSFTWKRAPQNLPSCKGPVPAKTP